MESRAGEPAAVAARLQRNRSPQSVSDAVLGGIDGCITTFAIVTGSAGAGFPPHVSMILGVANELGAAPQARVRDRDRAVRALRRALESDCVEKSEVIERILAHRRERGEEATPTASLGPRAPPQAMPRQRL